MMPASSEDQVVQIQEVLIVLGEEDIDVAVVLNRTVEAVRPLIEERGHALTVVLPTGPFRLEADPARLEQKLSGSRAKSSMACTSF